MYKAWCERCYSTDTACERWKAVRATRGTLGVSHCEYCENPFRSREDVYGVWTEELSKPPRLYEFKCGNSPYLTELGRRCGKSQQRAALLDEWVAKNWKEEEETMTCKCTNNKEEINTEKELAFGRRVAKRLGLSQNCAIAAVHGQDIAISVASYTLLVYDNDVDISTFPDAQRHETLPEFVTRLSDARDIIFEEYATYITRKEGEG